MERIDAKRLLNHAAHLCREHASQCARRPLLKQARLRRGLVELSQLRILPRRHVAEDEREDLDLAKRRIRVEGDARLGERTGNAQRHAIRFLRHADLRLRLDIEERLDSRRIVEIDSAARDQEALALVERLAADDLGAAEQHRPFDGAAQLKVGVGDQTQGSILHLQRGWRIDADIQPHR